MVRYRFGDFELDPRSGELTRLGADEDATTRLAPQPTQLLVLLLERYPEIVTHADIQQRLWTDVEVAFEQSLHHCIRQVRTALDDSATEPEYIQTIHRRGYQFIASVEVVADEMDDDNKPAPAQAQRRNMGLVAAGLIALLAGWLVWSYSPRIGSETVRVAVMPFQPPGENTQSTLLAEYLVARLTNHPDVPLEVIGPTTTSSFESHSQPLTTLSAALDVDYILNGRFPENESETRFLAEIIRAHDGAHVWATYFDRTQPDSLVAAAITKAFLAFQQEQP